MPLVHTIDLLEHARDMGYRVAVFELASLDHIVPVIEAAERATAPVILAFSANIERTLVPALAAAVAAARAAVVPAVIEVQTVPDDEAVARIIRGGANSILLCPAADSTQEQIDKAKRLAHAGGVPLFDPSEAVAWGDVRHFRLLPNDNGAARATIERGLIESGGNGRAAQALAACRPWREVEHLIVYNVTDSCDELFVEKMMASGRAALGAIPGVRSVFTGRALRGDARYRYCWLVRFASSAVVASYRDHPDHVTYADTQFRPIATDRISIDFESVE